MSWLLEPVGNHSTNPFVEQDVKKKPKKGYWYKFYYSECVLCGSHEEHKERMYTPKPKDPAERYEYSQYACYGHFL